MTSEHITDIEALQIEIKELNQYIVDLQTKITTNRETIPPGFENVPIFKSVGLAMKGGKPYPNITHQVSFNKNTLREFAIQQALKNNVSNIWAEFGVENGISARYFLKHLPINGRFHLFDSFKGLPESWNGNLIGDHKAIKIPEFNDERVKIHPGWFSDTLPLNETLGFVHIDCDLYSSTKTVLENIKVTKGTIILFDELFGYDEWENHEYKALCEYNQLYKYIGRDCAYRAAIEIL